MTQTEDADAPFKRPDLLKRLDGSFSSRSSGEPARESPIGTVRSTFVPPAERRTPVVLPPAPVEPSVAPSAAHPAPQPPPVQSDARRLRRADAELMPMPIAVIGERGQKPPTSSALAKMRQISHGVVASREGIVGIVLVNLEDSQPVVVASNPEHLFLDRLLELCRTSAAMFRGASLKASEHAREITGKEPPDPIVKSIQVESDRTVTINRVLESNHGHMLMLITLKSQPIGLSLMVAKQACQELEPLLEQHLAAIAAP
ncbi:hypothetical protein J4H92_08840 [Leucobacter weissii]|uniref:Uncharacterized protein n=1 Tax=Leucobacter weissii TaxID=1983706 RepID=A0A939SAK8_9MICO|nr:hypothetical protein [Leucobacter weissii]MBO1902052.1 hypothetical protein [Leucobacter weissii]